jgi:hypothetical protein
MEAAMTEPVPPKPRSKPRAKAAVEERPRGGRARAVSEMVPAIGGAAFRRFGFVQSSIVSRWAEIVGDPYARVSAPESIRFPAGKRAEGVLSLVVESAHAPMMQHVAPDIMERVNLFFGYAAVARIAIRQGAALPRRPAARPVADVKPVPAELGDSLKAIVDPELKAVLESLARGLSTEAPIVPFKLGKIA